MNHNDATGNDLIWERIKNLIFNVLTIDKAFCQEILEDLTLANNQHHSFVFESHGDCDRVEMDQKLLRQMLTNLLSNAVKYSMQGGTIHLQLMCQQEQVIFHIKDEGIGIPDADRERLFEVFHRASNVGTIPGTGLGMAIIKKAVDLHQGSITFSSSVGKGTTFTVCLPTRTKYSNCQGA
ncbi:MAG: ATP-binding protein [Crinalium sp.]